VAVSRQSACARCPRPYDATVNPTRAISIRDPWISAVLYAGKRVENRTWPTKYRGPIYLHSSKSIAPPASQFECEQKCAVLGITLPPIVRGALVATADLVDCVQSVAPGQEVWADASAWHFVLANVCRLDTPIPMRGALGIWRVDPRPLDYAAVDASANLASEVR
jgi:hypothetical protein